MRSGRGASSCRISRDLSLVAAKAVSFCLLGKVSKLGKGQKQAAKRRAWAKHECERIDVAMRAHWLANVLGRGVHREGGLKFPSKTSSTDQFKFRKIKSM